MADEPDSKEATDLVTEYLEKKAPEMHEAFGVGSSFNKAKSQYEAKEENLEFLETLQQYETQADEPLDFDPTHCSWEKVIDELNKAQDAAAESERRGQRFFTKGRRKLARVAPLITPGLQALSDELSILHGGLAVVFNLAHHRERNRKHILDAFEDIPEIIQMARNKSRNFPDDTNLREAIYNLRKTLLATIPCLVELLKPGTFLAKARSPFRGSDIESLLEVVQRSANQVQACAEDLRDVVIIKTHHNTETIGKTTTRIEEKLLSVGQDMGHHFGGVDSRMLELRHEQQFMVQQVTDALSSQNGMFQMLKDAVLKLLYEQEFNLATSRPRTPSYRENPAEQLASLLDKLHVPDKQDIHDLTTILQRSRASESAAATSQAGAILKSEQFQRWMGSRGSDLLLIEGHLDDSRFGKTSPMSFFSANLVQVFRGISPMVALHFFCGQHVASNDDLAGPRGLIRSLLAQLARTVLRNGPNDPSSSVNSANLDSNNHLATPTEDFCQVFRQLLRQVPSHVVVFCVIDDISRFERDGWLDDYVALMTMLFSLASDQRMRLKVLMTSPKKSRWLQGKLAPSQHMELRAGGQVLSPGTERSLWSAALGAILPGS